MRRLGLRILMLFRWPSAALAAITLGFAWLSPFCALRVLVPIQFAFATFPNGYVAIGFSTGGIGAVAALADAELSLMSGYAILQPRLAVTGASFTGEPGIGGWWRWNLDHDFGPRSGFACVQFPAWCVFVPLGAFAALGFRAKRRLAIPADSCPSCHHLLAGATICPECGTKIEMQTGVQDAARAA